MTEQVIMGTAIIPSEMLGIPAHKAVSVCSVKYLGDSNNNIFNEETNQDDFSFLDWDEINQWPTFSDAFICQEPQLEFSQSDVWIDESRSPFVYNLSGSLSQSSFDTKHVDYISNADYDLPPSTGQDTYKDEQSPNILEGNMIPEVENIIYEEIPEGQAHIDCPEILSHEFEDTESESEMLLSELKNHKIMKNPENDALKQLMSKDIQSTSKQVKTITFIKKGDTIQNIRYEDPRIKCSAIEVDHEEIVEDTPPHTPSPTPRKKKYQCDECKQIFHKLPEFRKHMNGSHIQYKTQKPKRDLACSDCDKKFSNYFKYQQHINGHGDPDLECPKCHKVYASKSTLKVHLKIHDRKYPCAFCQKSFADAEPYKKHLKRHSKFVCVYDGCMFMTDSETVLDDHHGEHLEKYISSGDLNDYSYTEKKFDIIADYLDENNGYINVVVGQGNDHDPNAGRMDIKNNNHDENYYDHGNIDHNKNYYDHGNIDHNKNYYDHGKVYNGHDGYNKNYNKRGNLKRKLNNVYVDYAREDVEKDLMTSEYGLKMEVMEAKKINNVESRNDTEMKVPKKRRYVRKCNTSKVVVDNEQNKKRQQADSVIAKVMSNKVFLADPKSAVPSVKKCKTCVMCAKSFDRLSDLKRHLIEHIVKATLAKVVSSEKGTLCILCEVCQKVTFSAIDKYKEHLREHAKLTIYKCGLCDKPFSDSSNFSKHKKIHSASFFQCDLCHRKFNAKIMLTKHMELHSKNEPLICQFCSRIFHFKSMLNKHIKAVHEKPTSPRYSCTFCAEGLKTLRDRWEHEWVVHNIRKMIADCLICSGKFRKFSDLKRHCMDQHKIDIPPHKKLLNKKFMQDVVCVQSVV